MNVSSSDDESLFSAALALPSGERAAYLDVACAGDPARRTRIASLLRSAEESPHFMTGIATARFAAPVGCEVIGRYKLLQKLGEGGCGTVYMAEQDEPVRRRVALKVIKLGMDTKEVIARFEAERHAIARMDHPNIARVLDAGATDTGRPYFVMELVRGDLDWIVMRCIEKNRTRRYETANELALDVHRYLNHEPVSARSPRALYRLGKAVQRHRTVAIASLTVVVALISGIIVSRTQAVRAQRAEQTAHAEAEISSAISSFLQYDLLGEAAAERQPNREVTLRAVVDRAAAKLDTAFPKQPLVEASIRDTVARVYHSLGDYLTMQRHMQRALEIGQKVRGPDDIHTLESMAGLAEAYRAQGKFAEAEKYFHAAMERQRRTLGVVHRETLISLHGLSLTYAAQGRHRESADLLEHTLEIQQRVLPDKHADEMLSSMNHLGLAYQALGRHAEAAALLERALATRQRLLGHEHPDTMSSMHSLAHARRREGRLVDAAGLATRAAELQNRVLGRDHPMALRGLNGLAVIRRAQGHLEEAAALGAETLDRQQRIVGPDNPDTLDTMHNLAVTYRELNRLPEALALLERALPARRATLGDDHPEIATTLGELGRVLLALRQPVAAEPPLREAIAWHEKRNASRGVACLGLQSVLGAVLTAQQRYVEAEQLVLSAHAGLKECEPTLIAAEKASLRSALNYVIELYHAKGDATRLREWDAKLREFDEASVVQ